MTRFCQILKQKPGPKSTVVFGQTCHKSTSLRVLFFSTKNVCTEMEAEMNFIESCRSIIKKKKEDKL